MHKTARRASSAKRAVPGEMSVTGFEDTALSRHIDPTLC
jgi:DNA-binding LacI/PurR family transcriptional regulator